MKSLISKVNRANIVEIWRVTYLTHKSNSTPHFVILLHDGSHICTCLMILNRGLICRHFFQVMIRSQQAKFSIFLIKRRWFKLEVANNLETNYNGFNSQEQTFMDINGQLSLMNSSTILGTLREDSKDITDVNMRIEVRHLYSDLFGLGRKIAQIATEKRRFDVLEIFNQVLEELYDDTNEESNKILNPYIVKSKGRPRNKRFKSSTEIHKSSNKNGNLIQNDNGQGSSQNNNSRSKACSNCNETSHNIRRCTAPCRLCKKDGHTYVNCKGKNVAEGDST